MYWPFAGIFQPRYITALAAGEGTSGLVAALLTTIAVATGAGPTGYFAVLAGSVALSAAAFWGLQNLRPCQLEWSGGGRAGSLSPPLQLRMQSGPADRDALLDSDLADCADPADDDGDEGWDAVAVR